MRRSVFPARTAYPKRRPGPSGCRTGDRGPRESLVEVLVHEFGHAASTPDDVEV